MVNLALLRKVWDKWADMHSMMRSIFLQRWWFGPAGCTCRKDLGNVLHDVEKGAWGVWSMGVRG